MKTYIFNENITIQAPDLDAAIATFHKRRPKQKIITVVEAEQNGNRTINNVN